MVISSSVVIVAWRESSMEGPLSARLIKSLIIYILVVSPVTYWPLVPLHVSYIESLVNIV